MLKIKTMIMTFQNNVCHDIKENNWLWLIKILTMSNTTYKKVCFYFNF